MRGVAPTQGLTPTRLRPLPDNLLSLVEAEGVTLGFYGILENGNYYNSLGIYMGLYNNSAPGNYV